MDNVSVIIRCRNEERWIGHSIQSALDFYPDSEIVIVDNDSTDDSMEIVRMFDKWHNIKKINIHNYSPGKALNVGVQNATGENILVLSSHCAIKKMDADVFNKLDKHVAVFGNQIPVYRGKRINKRYIWSHFTDKESVNMFSNIENRQFLHNAFCFYKRDFLLNYPFDGSLFGKEDRYWAIDMVEQGHKYLYDPSLECEHYWTPNGATWKGIG
jgi:glycosyltransferase involved in cell wall biosynthesis